VCSVSAPRVEEEAEILAEAEEDETGEPELIRKAKDEEDGEAGDADSKSEG